MLMATVKIPQFWISKLQAFYTLCFHIGSQMSNSIFVFGLLFSSKFHMANMIWVNDLRLRSFFATLTAVLAHWKQYKDFSSNASLACDKTDNKDQLSLGTDCTIVALKDTKCALHISYLLHNILRFIFWLFTTVSPMF